MNEPLEDRMERALSLGRTLGSKMDTGMTDVHVSSNPHTNRWQARVSWSDGRIRAAFGDEPRTAVEILIVALMGELEGGDK